MACMVQLDMLCINALIGGIVNGALGVFSAVLNGVIRAIFLLPPTPFAIFPPCFTMRITILAPEFRPARM